LGASLARISIRKAERMATLKRPLIKAVLFVAALTLAGCGLGRDSSGDGEGGADPIVAATVNGRPIYIEDVRAYAVARGWLRETEDLDANSDAFYLALEELIQMRLFAMEAEARGIDRRADVRRQIENARPIPKPSSVSTAIMRAVWAKARKSISVTSCSQHGKPPIRPKDGWIRANDLK
jgi:SurA N-terminal domain